MVIVPILIGLTLASCGQTNIPQVDRGVNGISTQALLNYDDIYVDSTPVDNSSAYDTTQVGYEYLDASQNVTTLASTSFTYLLSSELANAQIVCPTIDPSIEGQSIATLAVVNCVDASRKKIAETKVVPIREKTTSTASRSYKSSPIGPQTLSMTYNSTLKVDLSGSIRVVNVSGEVSGGMGLTGTFVAYACLWQQDIIRNRYIVYQRYVRYEGETTWYKSGGEFSVQQPSKSGDAYTKTLSGHVCSGPYKQ